MKPEETMHEFCGKLYSRRMLEEQVMLLSRAVVDLANWEASTEYWASVDKHADLIKECQERVR